LDNTNKAQITTQHRELKQRCIPPKQTVISGREG